MKPILIEVKSYSYKEVKALVDEAYLAGMHDGLNTELHKIPSEHRLDFVIKCSEIAFDMSFSDLKKKTRKRSVVDARTIIYWHIYPALGSLSEIGGIFNQDHATVFDRLKKYEDFFYNNIEFRKKALVFQDVINKRRDVEDSTPQPQKK